MNKKISGNQMGIIYFFIHFFTEIISFAVLSNFLPLSIVIFGAIIYDILAFVPQGLYGLIIQKYTKVPMHYISYILIIISIIFINIPNNIIIAILGIIFIATGNAIIHEYGALATVSVSKGKIFPSALFVAGGSFGVVIGQYWNSFGINNNYLFILLAIIIILMLLTNKTWHYSNTKYPKFNICKKNCSAIAILIIAFFITSIRSYMGYAIPISWNKEIWQTFLLFFIMGLGKGIGGWLVDNFGALKIGVGSTILAIPFLIIGDTNIIISVIGVFLFSMTMSITFAMCLDALPNNPAIAFGITTIGLSLGILPSLFHIPKEINIILIIILSLLCAGLFLLTLKKKKTLSKNTL